jgi:hypothetical protein
MTNEEVSQLVSEGLAIASREIVSCNVLKVTVATTGFCGGDSGHGARSIVEIADLSSTNIEAVFDSEKKVLRIEVGGDSEIDTLADALMYASRALSTLAGLK